MGRGFEYGKHLDTRQALTRFRGRQGALRQGPGQHTRVCTKRRHGLVGLRLRVKSPSLIGFPIRSACTLEEDVILTGDGLPIKYEKRDDAVFLPLLEIVVEMTFYSGKAAKCGKQRFVGGGVVEEEAEIIGGIDTNGTIFEYGHVTDAATKMSAGRQDKASRQ